MKVFIFLSLIFNLALSAGFDLGEVHQKPINITAVSMFLVFVLATLFITYYSNKKSKSKSGFYTAGGNITGMQNGVAIAGDYMSAASFLGITALVFTNGFDGLIYSIGFLVGWPIILFLIAEKFRNLGKFTFADITAYRLEAKPIRVISAISALSVIIFYLIAQMVGAGQLIQLLFGLPHILIRFFTVKDAKEARKSVFYATGFIGYFYILTFIIGFGAIALLLGNPQFTNADGSFNGASNMIAVTLADVLGGDVFLGFISAVAFATILAVVAGLAISGAGAISHDLYVNVIKKGDVKHEDEMRVTKIATIAIGIFAILLGIVFEKQNVAFTVGLAFAIAASVNFPILLLCIYWKNLTTKGAFWGGLIGLIVVLALVILSPSIWVKSFGFSEAIFPYDHPALFSMPLSFILIYIISKLDNSKRAKKDKEGFEAQDFRAQSGVGVSEAVAH